MKDYNFYYDVKYPVLVKVYDGNALNGKGYSFLFPMKVVLEANNPRFRKFLDIELGKEGTSFFCDEKQRISGEYLFDVQDKINKLPVFGAEINYKCGDEECLIGESDLDLIYSRLRSKLPVCSGGVLNVRKEGYFTYSDRLDVSKDSSVKKLIELEPFKELNIIVKKLYVDNNVIREEDISKDELVFVNFERLPYSVEEIYTTNLKYDLDSKVKVVPGSYEASISVLWDKEITIPEHRGCAGPSVLGKCLAGSYTIPEQTLPRFPIGNSEVGFIISESVYDKNTVVFYVFAEDLPQNWGEVENFQKNLDKYNTEFINNLEPKFS